MNSEQRPSSGNWPQMEPPKTIQTIVEETVKSLLLTGGGNISGTKTAVIAASRNIMQKILLGDGDMPGAAVRLLGALGNAAQKTAFDPAEVMKWGLEAIAGVAVFAPDEVQNAMGNQIDAAFMDTGAIFSEFCARLPGSKD